MHLLMLTCSLSTLDLHVGDITGVLHPSKSKFRMYSGCDYPYKSCSCTFWACHPYFIFQFYSTVLYLFLFFFITLSVIHQHHLTWFTHSTLNFFTRVNIIVQCHYVKNVKCRSSHMRKKIRRHGPHIPMPRQADKEAAQVA